MSGTPQFVGNTPIRIINPSAYSAPSGAPGCTKAVCKVLVPGLLIVTTILAILFLVRLFRKKSHHHSTPTAPIHYAQVPRAYPRNVPAYPAAASKPQQPTATPQAYNNQQMQFSSYQAGPNPTQNPQVAQMLDQRYVQRDSVPYDDNKMNAYQNYADALGAQGKVQEWDEAGFNKAILQQKLPALVAFVSSGCGWCEKLKPAFHEAAKHAKITLAMVDASRAGGLGAKYKVTGYPTIILFRGGEAVQPYQGNRSAESLAQFAQ